MVSSNGGSSPPTLPDVPPELEASLREALQPSFLLVRCLGRVASALAAAHAKDIIHRDIKPANILYDDESRRASRTFR